MPFWAPLGEILPSCAHAQASRLNPPRTSFQPGRLPTTMVPISSLQARDPTTMARPFNHPGLHQRHPYRELGTSEPPSNLAFGRESVGLSHRCSPPMRSRAAPGWWGWRRRSRPIPPTSGHVQDPDAPSRPVAVQTSQLYGPGAPDVLKAVTRGGCRLRNIDGEEDIHINQTAMRAAEHRGN
ncbi:hypothetical protein LXA43DRAFT_1065414 [Ganoderma leucocontextum]|nr:hypothetical protein LXA43DRAFT_1065414 [Ganoderma leucocontextum]